MNYFIKRDENVPYEQEGRYQDLVGAKKIDTIVLDFLAKESIDYKVVNGIGKDSLDLIVSDIISKLK